MKTCPRCKEEKQDSQYYRYPNSGKLFSYCNTCKTEREREYREANRDQYRETWKRYEAKHPELVRARLYRWRDKNRDRVNAIQRKSLYKNRPLYIARLRQEVMDAYGGSVCACCGEKEAMFLTIDHVNGDGADHRRELKKHGWAMYQWLKKHKFPSGFQVLCRNCNWGKHVNGVCPHRKS